LVVRLRNSLISCWLILLCSLGGGGLAVWSFNLRMISSHPGHSCLSSSSLLRAILRFNLHWRAVKSMVSALYGFFTGCYNLVAYRGSRSKCMLKKRRFPTKANGVFVPALAQQCAVIQTLLFNVGQTKIIYNNRMCVSMSTLFAHYTPTSDSSDLPTRLCTVCSNKEGRPTDAAYLCTRRLRQYFKIY